MAFLATLALVCVSILRPMEIWPALAALRLLDVFTALALAGVVFDVALGRRRQLYSPQLPFLLGFLLVSYGASTLLLGSRGIERATTRALLPSVFMLVVMYGAPSIERLRRLLVLVMFCSVVVGAVAVHQGMQEPQCVELREEADNADDDDGIAGTPDGRRCATKSACYAEGRPGAEYACERIGLFSTRSVARRVRWRGQLADPNELAVFIGALVPFLLMAAAESKRRGLTLLTIAVLGLDLYVVILTQSRGGQLMLGVVLATYFVGRYRKGVVVGALLALPVFLLGGRADGDADASTAERTDLLYEGITLVVRHPVLGLGLDGFQEELRLTAHNSYLLAAAELGLPGMFLWTGLLWASAKVPLTIARQPPERVDPHVRSFAVALVVSLVGMAVGIFFLSYTFKQLLYVWLGICGALYGAMRSSDPDFRVRIGARDCLGIAGVDLALLAAIYVYTRLKA